MAALAFALLAANSFLLHFVWEKMHIVLYTNYEALEGGLLPISLLATLGDVMYTLMAVGLVALFKGEVLWFTRASARDYAGLALLGIGIALFVEYKAFSFSRWAYTDAMPIIPFFNVGLSPVAQMAILLPLSIMLTTLLITRFSRTV